MAHDPKDHQLVYSNRNRLSREERLTRLDAEAGLGNVDNMCSVFTFLRRQQTPCLGRFIDLIPRVNPVTHARVWHD